MGRKSRTKTPKENSPQVSLADKLTFIGIFIASVSIVVAAYFGYLAVRQDRPSSEIKITTTDSSLITLMPTPSSPPSKSNYLIKDIPIVVIYADDSGNPQTTGIKRFSFAKKGNEDLNLELLVPEVIDMIFSWHKITVQQR